MSKTDSPLPLKVTVSGGTYAENTLVAAVTQQALVNEGFENVFRHEHTETASSFEVEDSRVHHAPVKSLMDLVNFTYPNLLRTPVYVVRDHPDTAKHHGYHIEPTVLEDVIDAVAQGKYVDTFVDEDAPF
jgi:hypothetical protein